MPMHLLMVAFDLTETTPGDARYRLADAALQTHGEVFWPVKQIRLLLTDRAPSRVKNSLQQQIGASETLLIAPLRSIPEWKITRAKQGEWRRFVEAVEAAGIHVDGLTTSINS